MFACIYIPDFPVEAIVRAEPLLRERAVAVLDGKPPVVRVIALNEKARLLGMDARITKLQASVFAETSDDITPRPKNNEGQNTFGYIGMSANRLVHKLQNAPAILRQRSPEQERSAHAAMLDVAHAFTPRVEDTAADTLLLDLAGLQRLYGPAANMARALALRMNAAGMLMNIAVAPNPEAAMHAARGFAGVTMIASGEAAQRLGVLPINVLLDSFEIGPQRHSGGKASGREREQLHEQILDTLERWGVRDFRMLALLPEHALAARLGETGARLQRLARGIGIRTLALCEPAGNFEEGIELESPVETLEPLAFILNRLLEQLCARLEARALAIQELILRLQLERRVADEETTTLSELRGITTPNGSPHEAQVNEYSRTLRLPVAMRDAKAFLKLLQLDLDTHPPGAPVLKVWIRAEPAPPRVAQRGLFLPVTPEAEKLEITLARIAGIVGERRAGIARLLDTHRRDGFRMDRFVASQDNAAQIVSTTMCDSHEKPPVALRIFRPPKPLQVQVVDERPTTLFSLEKEEEPLPGKILWSAGPWRSSGDWWTEQPKTEEISTEEARLWDREEWDIALTEGSNGNTMLYRIFRDMRTGQWFSDGTYD